MPDRLYGRILKVLADRGLVNVETGPNTFTLRDDSTGGLSAPFIDTWNTTALGLLPTEAELAAVTIAVANALPVTQARTKALDSKALLALARAIHIRLDPLDTMTPAQWRALIEQEWDKL